MGRGELIKLIRVLGMLGSDHPGERAAAALVAHRLIKSNNRTWFELLQPAGRRYVGGVIVRTVYEWGIDHAKAAEPRIRQVREENEQLRREVTRLRARLGTRARLRASDGNRIGGRPASGEI
jgi:hypothetical protein